jgi:lantibiotic leader peptide-processing serine protease
LRPTAPLLRLLVLAVLAVLALALSAPAGAARYLVVYKQESVPAGARQSIEKAGGRFVASYDEIGVAVADSDSASFLAGLLRDSRVEGASSLDALSFSLEQDATEGGPEGDLPNVPATDGDTFSSLQWNMQRIHAPEAHAVTGGSPSVVVGLLDSGIDYEHPDLAQNVDFADSASCVSGAPDQNPSAWRDDNGHGTHNAGTIAAAANGIGIVGVAPNVKIAAVKIAQANGLITPAAVICGFEWAAAHHFDVTNNSYTIDVGATPGGDLLDFYCHNDPTQQELITAVKRAVRHAIRAGVTVVASAGNSTLDLAHPPLGNECIRMPSELSGVIAVSATRFDQAKASYSNFGVGVIDVAAPGGDTVPMPPAGFVLSTWPSYLQVPRLLCDPQATPCPAPNGTPRAYYRFMAGSSMAAAHASGVAALIVSRYGDLSSPKNGKLKPSRVEAILQQTATEQPCPPDPTDCRGGRGSNAFFGHGIVDAFSAVTR